MQPISNNAAGPPNNTFSSIMDDPEDFLSQGGIIQLEIPQPNWRDARTDAKNGTSRKATKSTMPNISTRSLSLFLRTFMALFLYIFTFGEVTRAVHEAELVIERVQATAGQLREIIMHAASEGTPTRINLLLLGGFDFRLEDRSKDGGWDFVPNLHVRWMIFGHGFLRQCETRFYAATAGFTVAAFRVGFKYFHSKTPGLLDFLEVSTALISFVTSMAYFIKFHRIQSTYLAIEWVATLRPRPRFGVWWDVEQLSLPRAWHCWWLISLIANLLSFFIGGDDFWTMNPTVIFYWRLLIGLLLLFGLGHGLWVGVCIPSEERAMKESWKARVNACAFEANNALPEKGMDQEMEMFVV